jgi:hypothetical protein
MTDRFYLRQPKVEACIRWAHQQGYAFSGDAAKEYGDPLGLKFIDDQPYYSLMKFATAEEIKKYDDDMEERRRIHASMPIIEPGDRVRDPQDGTIRTVQRVVGHTVHMADAGVPMPLKECTEVYLESEEIPVTDK